MTSPTPSAWQSIWLVAQRELVVRLRSKSFLISTGLLLLSVLASIVVGGLVSNNASDTKVAVLAATEQQLVSKPGFELITASSVDEAEQMVRDERVEAAVVPDSSADNQLGFKIISFDEAPTGVVNALSVSPPVELLDNSAQSPMLLYFVALGFGLVFFMSAMTFGSIIAQSVVEEKSTRVVEILIATIPVRLLLAGKVIGNSILAFGQVAVTAALAIIGLTVIGQTELLGVLGAPIVWFVAFFILGFILLAAMFAATASMVSRQEDVASTTTPVTMLVMLPYFLVIFFNDNQLILTIMSYVPFSAPVAMPVRLFVGTAAWWEPVLSLLVLLASAVLMIGIGSRIYANSLLRMGSRVKLSDAIRGS